MRAFDTWTSYLDNDRNLLHGKIRFCRKGTTDNVTIYNSDGIAIRNPEFTDLLGRTEYQDLQYRHQCHCILLQVRRHW